MRETFRERDVVAPTKIELLYGLGCWLLYLSGIPELLRWLLPLLGFDLVLGFPSYPSWYFLMVL